MKVSFICTVFNEEQSINPLLKSIFDQSKFPDEIIIVDGGSIDSTVSEISNFMFPSSNNKARIKLIFKKGNRSVGRNEAIKAASNEIIACSDAGCILDKDWIKKISEPFENQNVDVVAGYYKGMAKNTFEKCIISYFLVMEDRINPNDFLPATRSMAFKKSVWKKVGGFDEKYSHNEDYVFAKKLEKTKCKIVFKKEALIYWIPQDDFKKAIISFYRFALGDAESGIFRPKVSLLFLRYFLAFLLIVFYIIFNSSFFLNLLIILFITYMLWSIIKNFKYVRRAAAVYYLPMIQLASDFAVMLGTVKGLYQKTKNVK